MDHTDRVTLTRTWSAEAANQALADESSQALAAASLLYAFKSFITGADPAVAAGAWTVVMSSGYSSGSWQAGAADYWDDETSLGWGTAGADDHSWIVFRSPSGFVSGGYVYLLIDCQGATVTSARLEWASAAFSGGSTTTCPTTTVGQTLGSSSPVQYNRTGWPMEAEWHGVRNTVGDFVFLSSRKTAGYAHLAWGALSTTGYETGDTYGATLFCNYNDTTPGALGRTQLHPATTRRVTAFWTSGAVTDTSNQCWVGPAFANVATGAWVLDSVDSNGSDINASTYYGYPVEIWSLGSGKIARRGKLVDILWSPSDSSIVQGTGVPSDASPERQIVGHVYLPFATKLTF